MAKKTSALSKLNQDYTPAVAPQTTQSAVVPDSTMPKPKKRQKQSTPSSSSPLSKLGTLEGDVNTENIERTAEPNQTLREPVASLEPDPQSQFDTVSQTLPEVPKEKKSLSSKRKESAHHAFKKHSPIIEPEEQPTKKATDEPPVAKTPDSEKSVDYDKLEFEMDLDEQLRARKERRAAHRAALANKVGTFFMVAACLYLLFLLYGALNTAYVYDDSGKIVAQKMSVQQIQDLHDYEELANVYRQARAVYEVALKLDYRIAAGFEDPVLIAPEYEELLTQIDSLVIQCQAVNVSSRYIQLSKMLTTWVKSDIAIYCQKMSSAISMNNAADAQVALEYRAQTYNDFLYITKMLVTMEEQVDGADITDIVEWSPEKYINEQIGAIGGELG